MFQIWTPIPPLEETSLGIHIHHPNKHSIIKQSGKARAFTHVMKLTIMSLHILHMLTCICSVQYNHYGLVSQSVSHYFYEFSLTVLTINLFEVYLLRVLLGLLGLCCLLSNKQLSLTIASVVDYITMHCHNTNFLNTFLVT